MALSRGLEDAPGVGEELAARVRALAGVVAVEVRPDGLLVIEVAEPGEVVRDVLGEGMGEESAAVGVPAWVDVVADVGVRDDHGDEPWPDRPRDWGNPGFVVRYAYVRAGNVLRWAGDLGVRGPFRPEALDDPRDRRVLRTLAEVASRTGEERPVGGRRRPEQGRVAFLVRLAEAYHDAFEGAGPLPKGDESAGVVHVARVWMAAAVRKTLGEGLAALGVTPPGKI
ncbi:DALR anticodon-binding domain-containing protein [Sphaerisporangium siamense]|uniref:Arginyl-tRNA synthetase n=1 Tax=Sphaerisporangium siamense TaxID=795645 RepID=A0A7W7DFI6_9ACTN|nr:DALR anticodon-binding domain-containing protein [Sphaerisporangium siamense]MBB4705676.1 arginyl-tRNA synthetase [Sphaerisporangium siamense]